MSKEIAKAVGHIPSGLFVVCTNSQGKKDGYLASWVQQVSFSPLIIAVAIKEDRVCYQAIEKGEVFSINIVGKNEMGYLKHFWSGYAPENNPFTQIDHQVLANGGVAIKAAASTIECKMTSMQKPGDHIIVFAEVLSSHINNPDVEIKTHIRKSGLDY